MTQSDLQALKTPLLAFLVVTLIGAAAVYYSEHMKATQRLELARQQVLFKDARTRLQKSGDEKEIIVKYIDRYRQMERLGYIGDEQRINWLDGLRLANRQADLFGVDYQIGVQRPYAYAADFNPGQLALNQSIMRLRFRLLHEEDLLRFFNALARQGNGLFTIDQCMLRRINTGGIIRYQPNVNAECDLSWITVKAAPGPSRLQ
ncbi:MAG TPA: hypothetical protein VKD25_06145 [Burkholderiales bacterium]|nr:hypothetical protein [Burkholderiales bacterium]